jgi:hypothetical protein
MGTTLVNLDISETGILKGIDFPTSTSMKNAGWPNFVHDDAGSEEQDSKELP